jgi:predicted transcriptional regulator
MIDGEPVLSGEIRGGMTRQEVADLFGVSSAAVYLVEREAIKKIRAQLEQAAAAAGGEVRDLWAWND